jgi:prevent-host-death family protein
MPMPIECALPNCSHGRVARVHPLPLDSAGHLSDTHHMVSFITTRELSKQPGRVMRKAQAQGPQVITQNGEPAAYLVPTSGRGIESDLDAIRRLLLGRALDAAQTEAARTSASELTAAEIAAEIAATRSARRTKKVRA